MTLSLAHFGDKREAIDLLQRVLQVCMFRSLKPEDREVVLIHLAWMREQRETMHVTCRLETSPELGLTRLVLETTFMPGERAYRGLKHEH